jgi:copper chaperone CopZ
MKTERYLRLYGANCPSCAYTIERVGKRLPKVQDVHVDTANARVEVDFDSADEQEQKVTLAKLVEVIQRIGYDATVETTGASTEQ